jgi:2-O-methyltransferase
VQPLTVNFKRDLDSLKIEVGRKTLTAPEIRELVGKDDPIILEIGANVGQSTREFLKEMPNARIYCFEPEPRAVLEFKQAIASENVQLFECAVGNKNGSVTFYQSSGEGVHKNWNQSGSIRKPKAHLQRWPSVTFEDQIDIKIVRLDDWAKTHGISDVDFIWADVQGAEGDVIQGGLEVLQKTRFFYTEYSNEEYYEGQITLKELHASLGNFSIVKLFPMDVLFANLNFPQSAAMRPSRPVATKVADRGLPNAAAAKHMPKRILRTPAGETEIVIPEPGDFASIYLFAMHKSGSSLMNAMMSSALSIARVPIIDISTAAFSAGLPENKILNADQFIFPRGYCYGGFRRFPPYLRAFNLIRNKKALLVRDPRDMLVSFYFSVANSHRLPAKGVEREKVMRERAEAGALTIDEYCLTRISFFKSEFASYRHFLSSREVRIYRYEDVIFDKFTWLSDMLSYFGVALGPEKIKAIAARHDIRPDTERPDEHIRQVTPGNFRKHLSGETIERINLEFALEMREYDYS